MNINDSERIATFFDENGLEEAEEECADVVVINSCSIRQSAIDRMEGKIKNINKKEKKPITILTGCLLKEDKIKIGAFFDYVLPMQDFLNWKIPFLEKEEEDFFKIKPKRDGVVANISIMTGCDNFCTYCVVPYTRGREFSRPVKEIIEEVKTAIKEGCKEVWLLGQNVNSYNGGVSFANLLREVNKIDGDFWIRFTSPHPKDFSEDLIFAMRDCEKFPKYLNLPVQSGDDSILKKMNRPYTIEKYKELVKKIKKNIPTISLSTDVIVGFPGETEKNFNNTINLFNDILFDMMYINRYSHRKGTVAFKMKETVSDKEKRERENILNNLLENNLLEKNKKYQNKELKILVLKKNRKGLLMGKTEDYKTVVFDGSDSDIGNFIKVKITNTTPWGLRAVKS